MKKQERPLDPFVILFAIIVACTIASYFVIPGAYNRVTANGVTRVIADSYHSVERTPVSFFQMFLSIPHGLTGAAAMMFVVMLIGGVVEIYTKTGVIGAAINRVLKLAEKVSSEVIISIIAIMFFIIGGILGWSEQIIPFVPIVISLTLALGYDSLVGMAISGFACLITFAVGPFCVYTVGISHKIAELPMFSGWQLRICAFLCVCALSLFWILRYARKIKKNPELSLMKGVDTSDLRIDVTSDTNFDCKKKVSMLVMLVSFIITIYGLLKLGWSFPEMGATFLIGGFIVAIINKMAVQDFTDTMILGMKAAFPGALIIGVARSIQWVMTTGGLVDPLVHGLSGLMTGASQFVMVSGMFIVNFFINALIPSGSGQAMAVMPIMIPLADMLDITRQTAVLAFQFGDGISNTFWFTNGTLLIYCGLAKVSLKTWYKFILPLHGLFFIMQLAFLYFACQISYGPF